MAIPVNRAMLASQAAATDASKIDQFPSNIGPHGMLLVFKDYKFQTSAKAPLLNLPTDGTNVVTASNGAVLLPIPNTLNDSTSMNITRFDMADTLGYASSAAVSAYIGGTFQDYVSTKTNSVTAQDILATAQTIFGDNFYLGAAAQGIGAAINPKASLLFKGVDLKEYSFEWTLAPTDFDESETLRKIVRKIKSNALPSYRNESIYTVAMLDYPSTVDIFLLGVDPNHYIKFKTAMISDVTINYTSNGLSILKGGKPASVSLTIRLKEMDIHTANDYGGGDPAASLDGGAMPGGDTMGSATGF